MPEITLIPIACPKCKKQKHLILEQPNHGEYSKPSIDIDCYCTKCRINFVAHCLYTLVNITDIEQAKEYPY